MAQFGESTTEQLMPQPRLAIALPMRHCLFLDLAKRQLAFVPRKWPHQQQQQQKLEQYLGGDNGIDGEEEERPAGGGQQRREVDTWLSFALSLIWSQFDSVQYFVSSFIFIFVLFVLIYYQ
jgi:hypothetical protein